MQTREESNQRHCRLKRKFTDEAEVMRVYSADVGVLAYPKAESRSYRNVKQKKRYYYGNNRTGY